MRYCEFGEEVIRSDNGELVGINFGSMPAAEHEWGYHGPETAGKGEDTFEQGGIVGLDLIEELVLGDGTVVVSNDGYLLARLRDEGTADRLLDRHRAEAVSFSEQRFECLWGERGFALFASASDSIDDLHELLEAIQSEPGAVSVSADFRPVFKFAGLSFLVARNLPLAAE